MAGFDIPGLTRTERLYLAEYETPSYKNFIGFVKEFLAPNMEMDFDEEKYYKKTWDDMWTSQKNHWMLPRGHSKTELIHIWATIYFAVYQPFNPFFEQEKKKKKRIIQQLLSSSDWGATDDIGDRIRDYLNSSATLSKYLPSRKAGKKGKYNTKKMVLRNGSIIIFRSIKTKRGPHVDRIAGDDYTTESSTLTDKETWKFFTKAILPMGTVKCAMVHVSGTPINFNDINMRIHAGDIGKKWNLTKTPAIIDWDNKTLLSPRRFSWKILMDKKEEIGSMAFESEYMLNPIDNETTLIKREWVEGCYDEGLDLVSNRSYFEEVYLGVDFAFSDRETADHSVFAIVGLLRGEYYLLNYHRRKGMSASEQLRYIQELHAIHKFDMIGLEENSIKSVVKDWKRLGLPLKLYHTGNVDERDKKKPDFTSTISIKKENLVLRLGTTFENHGIKIPYKSARAKEKAALLMNECISWQLEAGKLVEVGLHPDIPVSLAYALEVATKASFNFAWA